MEGWVPHERSGLRECTTGADASGFSERSSFAIAVWASSSTDLVRGARKGAAAVLESRTRCWALAETRVSSRLRDALKHFWRRFPSGLGFKRYTTIGDH